MRHFTLVLAAALVGSVGCGQPSHLPPASAKPALGVTAEKSAPPEAAGDQADMEDAPKTAASTPAQAKPAETPAAKSDDGKSKPTTREELLQKIKQADVQAMIERERKAPEAAYQALREGGKYAEMLVERFPDLNPEEKTACANAFYQQARGLSMGGEPEQGLTAIERAILAGWDELEQLDEDDELAGMRELPEFAEKYAAWERAISARMKAEVASELVDFKSYPFDFELPDLDAKPVKLADFHGKVVIVDIWGTWCPPCRDEVPAYVKLQTKYGEKGLQIIGLNYEDSPETEAAVAAIREFQKEQPMNYPCLVGDEKTQEQVLEFDGYPTTLFIDRTGKVRLQFIGGQPYLRLEAAVQALLGESGS